MDDFYLCIGMKHREERVVGGEVKPTASVFGEEEEEDPQVLYDKVSLCHSTPILCTPCYAMYNNIITFNDRGSLGNK